MTKPQLPYIIIKPATVNTGGNMPPRNIYLFERDEPEGKVFKSIKP